MSGPLPHTPLPGAQPAPFSAKRSSEFFRAWRGMKPGRGRFMIGTTLGHDRILSVPGSGGMGSVWLAEEIL
jgi:hypothetical protein